MQKLSKNVNGSCTVPLSSLAPFSAKCVLAANGSMQKKLNLALRLQWNCWRKLYTLMDLICHIWNISTSFVTATSNLGFKSQIFKKTRGCHELHALVQGAHNPSDPGWWYDCVTWWILGARTWANDDRWPDDNGSLKPHGTSLVSAIATNLVESIWKYTDWRCKRFCCILGETPAFVQVAAAFLRTLWGKEPLHQSLEPRQVN